MNNDLPPSSKFENCVMRNKESSLPGLIVHQKYSRRVYMRQYIKINIGVGGLHGNQFANNRPAKIS